MGDTDVCCFSLFIDLVIYNAFPLVLVSTGSVSLANLWDCLLCDLCFISLSSGIQGQGMMGRYNCI